MHRVKIQVREQTGYGTWLFEYNRYMRPQSGTSVSRGSILGHGSADPCTAAMPIPFHRKSELWHIRWHLPLVCNYPLWCISFWHDGKLVVIVHVIRIILQFDGSGQGASVEGCAASKHTCTHTKNPGTDLHCWEWRQSLQSSSLFCDQSFNNQW